MSDGDAFVIIGLEPLATGAVRMSGRAMPGRWSHRSIQIVFRRYNAISEDPPLAKLSPSASSMDVTRTRFAHAAIATGAASECLTSGIEYSELAPVVRPRPGAAQSCTRAWRPGKLFFHDFSLKFRETTIA